MRTLRTLKHTGHILLQDSDKSFLNFLHRDFMPSDGPPCTPVSLAMTSGASDTSGSSPPTQPYVHLSIHSSVLCPHLVWGAAYTLNINETGST